MKNILKAKSTASALIAVLSLSTFSLLGLMTPPASAGSSEIARTFEFGQGTANARSNVRAFAVPSELAVTAAVEFYSAFGASQDSPCNIRLEITSVRESPRFPGVTPLPVADESGRQIYTTRWEVKWRLAEDLPPCTDIQQYKIAVSNSTGFGETTIQGNVTSAFVTTRRVEGELISRFASNTVTGTARTRIFGETVFRNGSISRPNNVCNLIPISITTNLAQARLERIRTSSSQNTPSGIAVVTPGPNLEKHGLTISWTATLPTQPPLCVKIDGFTIFAKIRLKTGVVKEGTTNVSGGTTSATVLFGNTFSLNPATQQLEVNELDRVEEVRVTARVSPDITIRGVQYIR